MSDTPATISAVLDENFVQHPHAVLAAMRADEPVRRMAMARGLAVWVISRHAGARAALPAPRLAKDVRKASELFERHAPAGHARTAFSESLSSHMLNSDPP